MNEEQNYNYRELGVRCAECHHNNHYDFDKHVILEKCRHAGGWTSDYERCECPGFIPVMNQEQFEWLLDTRLLS